MPRNVRNFWIEGETDNGTEFGTGPRAKEGGFFADIYMREDGGVRHALKIRGWVDGDRVVLDLEHDRPRSGYSEKELLMTPLPQGGMRIETRR